MSLKIKLIGIYFSIKVKNLKKKFSDEFYLKIKIKFNFKNNRILQFYKQ